jgi:hypothetical protein
VEYQIDVRGRLPDGTLDVDLIDRRRIRVLTMVTVGLRDDAALHGLLRRIQGLALELVELRRLPADEAGDLMATARGHDHAGRAFGMDLLVAGGLGEAALGSFADVCTLESVGTRLVIDGSPAVGDVLLRLESAGLAVVAVTGRGTAPPAVAARPSRAAG